MTITVEPAGTITVNSSGTVEVNPAGTIGVTHGASIGGSTINVSTVAQRTTSAGITGGVDSTVAPDTNFDTDMIGAYVVVNAFSTDAEIATVTGAAVITAVDTTFNNSHASGVPVVILQNDILPVRLFGGASSAALAAACTAATDAGIPYVQLPAGTIDVGNGFSMSGYSCGLIGQGTEISILDATTATGYVLDLSGWTGNPANNVGNVLFGGFMLVGKNAADATKAQGGLDVSTVKNVRFFDIAVKETGGPGVYLDSGAFFNTFDKLTIQRPVGANTNDVPYLQLNGAANGNTFNDLLLRSTVSTADGTSVVKIADDGTDTPTKNVFNGPMLENQNTPNNGSVFEFTGATTNTISYLRQFDTGSDTTSPSGNCWIRFKTATGTASNFGSNMVIGYVPGRGTNSDAIQYGIIDEQGGNMAFGIKGFRGYNFRVTYTGSSLKSACFLLGAESAATDDAFSYGAGVAEEHHYLFDAYDQRMVFGEATIEGNFSGSFPGLILKPTTANNVYLYFGSSSGNYIRYLAAASGTQYYGATTHQFENQSGTDYLSIGANGIINFQGTMGNSTKSPTTDAPTDWVEIKIGGTAYYLPAYTAS